MIIDFKTKESYQKPFFFKNINGKTIKLRHRSRHKANHRQIAIIIFLEAMNINDDICPEVKLIFNTAYNIGYKEGQQRSLQNHRCIK